MSGVVTRGALVATAFHEAGHVVQAYREGLAVRSATIVATEGAAGHVLYAKRLLARGTGISAAVAERRGRAALAGAIAQRRHNPRSVRSYHAAGDRAVAADLALAISGSGREAEARLRLWMIQTEQALDLRWLWVEAVAAALIQHKVLMAPEISEILHARRLPGLRSAPRA